MELLAEAAEDVIAEYPSLAEHDGSTFFLDASSIAMTDKEFVVAATRNYLLGEGMVEKTDKAEADLIVTPRASAAAIDDHTVLVGLPPLSFSSPVGGLELPELSLFKVDYQRGRNRMGFDIIDSEGQLAIDQPLNGKQVYYTRWTVLSLITFRTTNLENPF